MQICPEFAQWRVEDLYHLVITHFDVYVSFHFSCENLERETMPEANRADSVAYIWYDVPKPFHSF